MNTMNYETPEVTFGEEGVPTPRCLMIGFVVFVGIAAVLWSAAAAINWAGVAAAAAAAVIVGVGVDC